MKQDVLAGALAESPTIVGCGDLAPPAAVDRSRLERLFAAHHEAVWRALRRRGLTEQEAEDATQETFLIAAGRLADIQSGREQAFLVATARRVAYTLGRKTKRWHLEEEMDLRVSGARDAADEHADVELCDLALSRLSPEQAEVFVLYEIEGLSSPEIAALLEIPLGSVASRLRSARELFRTAVARIEQNIVLRRAP